MLNTSLLFSILCFSPDYRNLDLKKSFAHIASLIRIFNEELADSFEKTENMYFAQPDHSIFSWDEKTTAKVAESKGFTVEYESEEITGKRQITEKDISLWFSTNSEYGKFLLNHCPKEELDKVKTILTMLSEKKQVVDWNGYYSFFILTANQETA